MLYCAPGRQTKLAGACSKGTRPDVTNHILLAIAGGGLGYLSNSTWRLLSDANRTATAPARDCGVRLSLAARITESN